ncbi:MAG: YcxB family protein [Oscillospiraceae bacterium]|nr:YcxB family protein [Oscillospiraceae bacterium]
MKISYDNTVEESAEAFMLFWREYHLKRTIMLSIAFGIGIFVSVISIVGGSGITAWILLGAASGFLLNLWMKPRRSCKKLVEVLETMASEVYTATFASDLIEVETIIQMKESENPENSGTNEITDKSQIKLSTEELCSRETQELFVLYVNRSLVYAFPKRCMDNEEITGLRTYFEEKRI